MDFFVVGTSRSGSTLLRHMLAAHPDVAILNESHWLPRMWESFGTRITRVEDLVSIVKLTDWDTGRRVVDVNLELSGRTWESLMDGLRARLGEETRVAEFHDALVDEVFAAAPDSVRRGDKTPDYGFYMATLQRLWPEARFVHIVRNGIETARSMSLHSGCQLMISAGYDNWVPLSYDRAYLRYERIELPLSSYVASWRRRMARIRKESAALTDGSYLEVRYETLVTDPAQVVEAVAAHLDLALSEGWLDRCLRLVRPRSGPEPVTAETFCGLTLADLEALNDVGSVGYFLFPPDVDIQRLEAALTDEEKTLRQRHSGDPLRVAIGVLATRTAARNNRLRARALTLLYETVTSRGDDSDRWAVLAGTEWVAR
jgi:hypothetical protein